MQNNLSFDTLRHAKLLEKAGIEHSDIHASVLADALNQNIYTKHEVDNMFATTLKHFDDSVNKSMNEFRKEFHRMEKEFHRIELEMNQIEKRCVKRLTINMSIVIAIFTMINAVLNLTFR